MRIGVALTAYISTPRLLDLAVATMDSIRSAEHELVWITHSNHPMPAEWQREFDRYGPTIDNGENCLSRAWNRGINHLLAVGCEYVFVPNLDIELASWSLDALVAAAERRRGSAIWTMSTWEHRESLEQALRADHWMPYPHFSAFLIGRTAWDVVGPFDEAFKMAYDEDLDYHWRVKLAGFEAEHYEGARFFHHGSATIQVDSELRRLVTEQHRRNDAYFRDKWGDKPATCCDGDYSDLYRHPFDDPERDGFEKAYATSW